MLLLCTEPLLVGDTLAHVMSIKLAISDDKQRNLFCLRKFSGQNWAELPAGLAQNGVCTTLVPGASPNTEVNAAFAFFRYKPPGYKVCVQGPGHRSVMPGVTVLTEVDRHCNDRR